MMAIRVMLGNNNRKQKKVRNVYPAALFALFSTIRMTKRQKFCKQQPIVQPASFICVIKRLVKGIQLVLKGFINKTSCNLYMTNLSVKNKALAIEGDSSKKEQN
jgi:hypothetical protein